MIDGNTFVEVAAIMSMATILGVIGQKLRQPLVIIFLLTGILAGPAVLGIIHSYHQIELLAHIGIALLLFIVGLRLDLNLIRTTGPVALATGLGQIVFTSVIGFIIAIVMDMSFLTAAYVSVALTFSSTIIIVKLLSDKKEIDSLHGQIAIGFLIVQDIAAILALVALTTFGTSLTQKDSVYISAIVIGTKGFGLLVVVALLMKYILPKMTNRLINSVELLTLFAITWAIFLSSASELLGFSKELGAFLAGVSLASTKYRDSIGDRLTSLRDFLLLFFFIDLGARLDWSTFGSNVGTSLIFSLFVLIGNPLIVLIIMGLMGYRSRTGFLAGLTVAQISEFSLIVAALGLSIGHITNETMGLITLVGIITIFISTYMILYSSQLYNLLSPFLKVFEKENAYREAAIENKSETATIDVILVGLGNYGSGLAHYLLQSGKTILGVDFNPTALNKWREKGVPVLYGDIANQEIYDQLLQKKTQWIVSTVRLRSLNLALAHNLGKEEFKCKLALTATNEEEAEEFKNVGAHLVFRPFDDAAQQAAGSLTYAMDFMPDNIDWPISFIEVRIRSDASVVGKAIRDIPLREITRVSILAINRGGHVYYDPESEFKLFPGDHLLIIGPLEGLRDAERILNQHEIAEKAENTERFEIADIMVADTSELCGKSLKDIRFRQKYGVTVVGIRRGKDKITAINPSDSLLAGDSLIVIGTSTAVNKLKMLEPYK